MAIRRNTTYSKHALFIVGPIVIYQQYLYFNQFRYYVEMQGHHVLVL